MKNLLALNWKMNKTKTQAQTFVKELKEIWQESSFECVLCAGFTNLDFLSQNLPYYIKLGSQDVSDQEKGAFTGDISAEQLSDLNVKFAIVGHSERREYQFESSKKIAQKAKIAQKYNITPIVCVGENLAIREANKHIEFVLDQLQESIKDLDGNFIVAYEPIWAIGTGKTASVQDASLMCDAIREKLVFINKNFKEIRILYGGSVKPDNIAELLSEENINGTLVGGASLQAKDVVALATSI